MQWSGSTRTGKAPGREVVQLYLSAPGKSAPKPALELRGFAKSANVRRTATFERARDEQIESVSTAVGTARPSTN